MTTPDEAKSARRPSLQRETSKRGETLWKGATAGSIGLEMAIAVIIGLLIGRWLDARFDTDPVWTIVFLCVGIAAAFKGLIRVARQHQNELKRQAAAAETGDADGDGPQTDEKLA